MAFTDPLALTIGGSARNLTRIDSARGQSEYSYTDSTMRITAVIRNIENKPDSNGRVKQRHTISVRQTVFATATTPEYVRLSSFTIEHYFGDDVANFDDVGIAVGGLATSGNILKLSNFES